AEDDALLAQPAPPLSPLAPTLPKIPNATLGGQGGEDSAVKVILPGEVPVTILTGFLGSGKTTLLNYILTQHHGYRIAVIENEFGDSMEIEKLIAKNGVDGSLLADNLFELKNGCICCTVKDDLVTTLETLLERRGKFDYIIIETTGLANPGPVASMFWLDEALESALRLDGIVTVVDAKNIWRHLRPNSIASDDGDSETVDSTSGNKSKAKYTNEATMQIAFADRIIVNKIDLVGESELNDLNKEMQIINSVAGVHCTQRSVVDIGWILNIRSFNPEIILAIDPALRDQHHGIDKEGAGPPMEQDRMPKTGDELSSCSCHTGDTCKDSKNTVSTKCYTENCSTCQVANEAVPRLHHPKVTTHSVECVGDADLAVLERWIGELLWEEGGGEGVKETVPEVYRLKGLVSVEGRGEKFVVQGVADLFEVTPSASAMWEDGEERRCKLVFIGKHLRVKDLDNGLRACIV
ncbi:unnamed protein product, partial [Choristocarpus tenellus]